MIFVLFFVFYPVCKTCFYYKVILIFTRLVAAPTEPAELKAIVMDSESIMLSWRTPRRANGVLKKYSVYMRSLEGLGLVRVRSCAIDLSSRK